MSWGISTSAQGAVAADGVADAIEKAVDAYKATLASADTEPDPAALEQIDKAKAAALELVASGIVGTGTFYVSLSGHANPGHKPVKGWANDCVSVNVSCADQLPAT